MLGIPFISNAVRSRAKRSEEKHAPSQIHPDLSKPAVEPVNHKLMASRALMVMGRYIEALKHVEDYLVEHPESIEGMITAGLVAARMRQVAMARQWFTKASEHVTGRAKKLLEPLNGNSEIDLMDIEDLVAEAEAHPEDRERAVALACALGKAGHFRAVERFIPILDS